MAALAEHDLANRNPQLFVLVEQRLRQNFGRAAVLVRNLRQNFRSACSGVGCIVVDTKEQVRRGRILFHNSAAQRQLAAFLKGIAHHDNLCTGCLKVLLEVLRHIQIDVLLIERTAVVRADIAAAVTRVDNDRHHAVNVRGARRLYRIVILVAADVVAHARQVSCTAVAAAARRVIHNMRPAVADTVNRDFRAVFQHADQRAGGARARADRQLGVHGYTVHAACECLGGRIRCCRLSRRCRLVRSHRCTRRRRCARLGDSRLGLLIDRRIVIPYAHQIVRAAVTAAAACAVQQMCPAVRQLVHDNQRILGVLTDFGIGFARTAAHGQRRMDVNAVHTGRERSRSRCRRRCFERNRTAGYVIIRRKAECGRHIGYLVVVVSVDDVTVERNLFAVHLDDSRGGFACRAGQCLRVQLSADRGVVLAGRQGDNVGGLLPAYLKLCGAVAQQIRYIAQLEIIILVN